MRTSMTSPPKRFAQHRGTLTEPGKDSPYRDRSVEENLDLFERMRKGEFPDGTRVLRAKIDMASPNLNMRDPVMYRILHAEHHRTGDKWCIYPMYDFAHGQSDSLEKVTHSMCTLEFTDHQPLYKWYIEQLGIFPSQQIEFDRLSLTYTLLSKRKLLQLVQEKRVNGWDDPRMPTLCGIRRRGFTPEAIRNFCAAIGASRTNGSTDIEMLEHFQREDLNKRVPRAMAVLRPLKVVIENYPEGEGEFVEVANNPEDPAAGARQVPFSREIYIEQDDFREVPPPKYYRLSPGKEVRLRNAYFITAKSVVKDAEGNIVEVRCTYDPASRGGNSPDGRKVKSTIHWVSASHAIQAEIRIYDKLFTKSDPGRFRRGRDLPRQPQSRLAGDGARRQTRALARPRAGRGSLSVRARRLLLRRSRFQARQPGLQSNPAAQRHLGKDRKESGSVTRKRNSHP